MAQSAVLLKAKVSLFLSFHPVGSEDLNQQDIIHLGEVFLRNSKPIYSDYYDLIMMIDVCAKAPQGYLKYWEYCRRFVANHSEREFITLIRYIVLQHAAMDSRLLADGLFLGGLLADFYGAGVVVGVKGAQILRRGLTSSKCGSLWDIALATIVTQNPVKLSMTARYLNGDSVQIKILSPKMVETIQDSLIRMEGLMRFTKELQAEGMTQGTILNHLSQKLGSIFGRATFSSLDGDAWRYMYTINMMAENPKSADLKSPITKISHYISQRIDQKLLHHRSFYVREKGVIAQFSKPMDDISRIYMSEIHNHEVNEHYIFARIWDDDGLFVRDIILPLDDFYAGIVMLLIEVEYTGVWTILYLLGLWDRFIEEVSKDELYAEPELKTYILNTLKNVEHKLQAQEIYYEDPLWWNYDINSNMYTSAPDKPKVLRKVTVGRYTRALPAGQCASVEARRLAALYHIELKPGYTMVDEFIRSVRVSAPEKTSKFE